MKGSTASSSLNTGTTSDSSGSPGRRARWPASWRSTALVGGPLSVWIEVAG
jgi:hypothetical protein